MSRAFPGGARLFRAGCCGAVLWACGAGEVPEEPLQIPEVDGEAWDAHIELGRPGYRIEIRAAYLREFSKSEQVVATGGVEVAFRGDEAVSTLRAERLVLEHKRDRFGVAGGVVLQAGDSLEVQSDTLLWESVHEQLRIPGALRVEVSQGREWGRNLTSNFAVDAWSLEAVEGLWRGRDGAMVEVRARREESRRVKGVQEIAYDSVEVRYDGVKLSGPRATFLPEARRFDLSGGVEGADSLAQFAADEVAVDAEKQRLVARGEVRYQEEEAELRAAEVEEDRSAALLQARGEPATFVQGERQIEARQLAYLRSEQKLTAQGGVVLCAGARELTAQTLRYTCDGQVHAEGAIALKAPELDGSLAGDSLFFDLEQEAGWMRGAPSLRQRELVLTAPVLQFDLVRGRLAGTGGFALRAEGLEVAAARGAYEADSTRVLVAEGVVLEERDDERDYHSRLMADSMVVALADSRVEWIAIPGQVSGQIEVGDRRSWIEGRGGQVFMADGDLERVEVSAAADVTHRRADNEEINRFRGQQMTLYFDAAGLHRALVKGAAELVTRLQEDEEVSVNEVSGEELDIRFAEGSLAEVRVGPEIEGRYYPPAEEP
ncbi:MAG: hypothetical protein F4Y91_11945 [Gemmatimonadetes bacterium]|nr:hypothetical protein [Gemmatimonadota bacterium]MXY82742.1 hypothetical protein [Gemmatimonadota bacterium]MYB70258.1 hypothetical protein [Gemmatimonadota bacterium]